MTVHTNLQEQLDEMKEKFVAMVPKDTMRMMVESGACLAESGLVAGAKKAGDKSPDFTLPNVLGEQLSLGEALRKGPVVLTFYRGAWCPYCNVQFGALQSALGEIEAHGATLIGISPSTPDNSLSMAQKHEIKFEVVSDVGNKVAREYGLVYTLDEALRPIYEGFDIDIPGNNGDNLYELPIAATYVIGRDGVIRYAFLDTDYTRRMEPADIVAKLRDIAS